ncbi:hypothetical protein N7540_006853 [Penicillium herquei]|nr:hypothetical protein N7540_006853 [Penicillium herquei]
MSRVQQYWLPGYGLSRHIVLGHIHYFLGPTASVRPFSYQEQIDDLAVMSREYEQQEAVRMTSQAPSIHAGGYGDSPSRHSSEPYINELIPVENSRPRRRTDQESSGGR